MGQFQECEVPFQVYDIDESRLLNILKSFKVSVSSITLERGRFFDYYYIKLSPGVRASKLDRLLKDIGLALGAQTLPTGTLLMSKGVYRLSVQREEIESPTFGDMLNGYSGSYYMPLFIGISESGEAIYSDLNKMPNLIVGGTTGSGKSVLLHSLAMSLLKHGTSLYLCDPKMVEFDRYTKFDGVKKVVSSPEDTSAVIKELTAKMNQRFSVLKRAGARSADELVDQNGCRKISPICLIIDEWADLVLQEKGLQKQLCVLAQKGRAAGISVVLATQRPASSVISGLVKANFPGRIAMRVASAVDSRVILDKTGAEKIDNIGVGLILDGRSSEPTLFRAPNISDIDKELSALNLKKSRASGLFSFFGF
jgi:S-DNA-T family DNA segregation ATPase FtsK/SpoIIIE